MTARRPQGTVARRLARAMANLVYRDIDVHLPAAAIPDGPIVAVSNHFGGLSDGVLLIDSLPRMPRVVARDAIWRVPVAGRLASAIGMIPVHRAADGVPTSNDAMFQSAYAALRDGDLVLIFPEGVTQDVPHMAPLRTGAARILLGAAASGVPAIHILPIGLHYEDKAGFRSRALVNVGAPIDLDAWIAERAEGVPDGADDRVAVHALTSRIDSALRTTAPDYPDWPTARAMETAADVLLHDVDRAPAPAIRYGDRALLASRLYRTAEPARTRLVEAGTVYRDDLSRLRTTDRAVEAAAGGPGRRSWGWLLDLALVVLLLPYALVGLLAALGPLLLTGLASRAPVAAAVRATVVPGVALLTFVGEWLAFSWASMRDSGLDYGLAAVPLFWFFVAALFLVLERIVLLRWRWRSRKNPRHTDVPALRAHRAELAEQAWGLL